jgi:hypothetical protein
VDSYEPRALDTTAAVCIIAKGIANRELPPHVAVRAWE